MADHHIGVENRLDVLHLANAFAENLRCNEVGRNLARGLRSTFPGIVSASLDVTRDGKHIVSLSDFSKEGTMSLAVVPHARSLAGRAIRDRTTTIVDDLPSVRLQKKQHAAFGSTACCIYWETREVTAAPQTSQQIKDFYRGALTLVVQEPSQMNDLLLADGHSLARALANLIFDDCRTLFELMWATKLLPLKSSKAHSERKSLPKSSRHPNFAGEVGYFSRNREMDDPARVVSSVPSKRIADKSERIQATHQGTMVEEACESSNTVPLESLPSSRENMDTSQDWLMQFKAASLEESFTKWFAGNHVMTDVIGGSILVLLHAALKQQTYKAADARFQHWEYMSFLPPLLVLLLISCKLKWYTQHREGILMTLAAASQISSLGVLHGRGVESSYWLQAAYVELPVLLSVLLPIRLCRSLPLILPCGCALLVYSISTCCHRQDYSFMSGPCREMPIILHFCLGGLMPGLLACICEKRSRGRFIKESRQFLTVEGGP